jgi:hypothetical protein
MHHTPFAGSDSRSKSFLTFWGGGGEEWVEFESHSSHLHPYNSPETFSFYPGHLVSWTREEELYLVYVISTKF